jgi:class 3 adenylate cyclase
VALDDAPLAASIVRYVGRTGETVVLDDAVGQTRFGLDPRTAGLPHLSVLCTPLTHRGRRTGILYLENELVAGAFTPERTRLLEVLAHQAAVSLENARVRDESRVLLEAAGRFVPGPMVRALGRESVAELEPGDAVEREMSVLFSDLRGYTRRSENLDARESFRWLNDYLERISPVVGVYGGFVDRFVGDATMALFPDGVEGAVRAAVAMLKEVRSLNADRSAVPGAGEFHAGIGLHFGSVMLGAVGSSGRMEITSIGDAVNVAARLENATKPLDAALLISGSVARRLPAEHGLTLRSVGRLGVEGRTTPLEVWEVLDGESPDRAEAKGRVSDLLARGIERFQEGEMVGAADLFEACMEDSPTDAVARAYLEASRDLATEGSPEDWTGELRLGKG